MFGAHVLGVHVLVGVFGAHVLGVHVLGVPLPPLSRVDEDKGKVTYVEKGYAGPAYQLWAKTGCAGIADGKSSS